MFKLIASSGGSSVLKGVLAFLGTMISYFLPHPNLVELFLACFGFILLDTIGGVLVALRKGDGINVRKLSRFLYKMFAFAMLVIVVSVSTKVLPGIVSAQEIALQFVMWSFVIREGVSILHKIPKLGVSVPKWLTTALKGKLDELEGGPDVVGKP